MGRKISIPILLSVWLGLSGIVSAGEKYAAKLLTRGGPNTEPVTRIEIEIASYTTGEEAWQLLQTLNQSGYEPFITAFRQSNRGTIRFLAAHGLNIAIHVAQSIPKENGKTIMLFTERQAWEVDVSQRTDGRFPFMIVELNVDNKGKGEGRLYENAQIKMQGEQNSGLATMLMESYNSAPKILFGVQLVK